MILQSLAHSALIRPSDAERWRTMQRLSLKDVLARTSPEVEFVWRRELHKEVQIHSETNAAGLLFAYFLGLCGTRTVIGYLDPNKNVKKARPV